jgi:hypothetical protein
MPEYSIRSFLWRRRISQQTGNSGEIGLSFDFGAENVGKLATKIIIGASMANDNGTDDCCLSFIRLFLRLMCLMQFSL